MSANDNIISLFERFTRGECSREELLEFYQRIGPMNDSALQNLLDAYYSQQRSTESAVKVDWDQMFQQIVREQQASAEPAKIYSLHFLKSAWLRYAAVLLIVAGAGIWAWNFYQGKPELAANNLPAQQPAAIHPGGSKAVLTLSDGRTIILDGNGSGGVADQGETKIIRLNEGALAYVPQKTSSGDSELLYNTITTPKGGQYQVVLPDGSKVWLNAASSIRFPIAFGMNERKVEITGECYLEIAKNRSSPFRVESNGTIIQVLGTSFNVNAYSDEPAVRTTLETGSINVNDLVLKPGQAYWKGGVVQANLEKELAWKNGLFNFEGATLREAMRQLERWYDIEVVYERGVREIEVVGKITKSISLTDLLAGFKDLGVHYKLEGRKLTIMP